MERLRSTLSRIDGRGYKAYKDIAGTYTFPGFTLSIDHVQGDPFAAPSRLRVRVPFALVDIPDSGRATASGRIALRDFLTRSFARAIRQNAKGSRGTGKSGMFAVDVPGQEILDRTSCLLPEDNIEIRFFAGLPARGRTVLGGEARTMFFSELPAIVHAALYPSAADLNALEEFVHANEDQDHLRGQLRQHRLVTFIADGAILPRRSGIDPRPLDAAQAVPFQSPPSLRITLESLHRGPVTGTGIPEGVTLIAGGGFHGKSTLLRAMERGVYNHIPGDGRELVVSRTDAVKIRAEDGRAVTRVNISPFIDTLPAGRSTVDFSTTNASGSTSQATNIMEALELGSRCLLIDEDTSATNFMIRDERMQALVSKPHEPITPFVDKVRQLCTELCCSTVLVMGGSGDYFDVADRILVMEHYLLHDRTGEARQIITRHENRRRHEGSEHFGPVTARTPHPSSFDPSRGRREIKIGARDLHQVTFGNTDIDLGLVEQLAEIAQTRTIAEIILFLSRHYPEKPLAEALQHLYTRLDTEGLDLVCSRKAGDYALPRLFETGAAINRMRSLKIQEDTD